MLALLANPESRAVFAEVAGRAVPPAVRERALARLADAGLVEKGADGTLAVAEARLGATLRQAAPAPMVGVERFLSRDGRIVDYPSRPAERRELLESIAQRVIGPDEVLSEPQSGERFARVTDYVAALRRYLVDAGLLLRTPDGSACRRAGAVLPG